MDLIKKINEICTSVGVNQSNIDTIIAEYNRPWRHYHNLIHIQKMMSELESVNLLNGIYETPIAQSYAVIMHDYRYIPGKNDNENLSALDAVAMAEKLDWKDAITVLSIIGATEHKTKIPRTQSIDAIVADIDLIGLGKNYDEFIENGEAIKKEIRYFISDITDLEFIKGRAKFFMDMLNKPCLFQTPYYNRLYEVAARININKWIVDHVN